MTLFELCQWLENTELGEAFLGSRYLYPFVEGIHLLGLALSVGLVLLTDLRLIGVYQRGVPVADILDQLRPWLVAGFILTFISGGLLFWPVAATLYESNIFRLKALLIVVAGINALLFEFRLGRRVAEWGQRETFPIGVRAAAWVSLSFWTTTIVLGRLYAYYPHF